MMSAHPGPVRGHGHQGEVIRVDEDERSISPITIGTEWNNVERRRVNMARERPDVLTDALNFDAIVVKSKNRKSGAGGGAGGGGGGGGGGPHPLWGAPKPQARSALAAPKAKRPQPQQGAATTARQGQGKGQVSQAQARAAGTAKLIAEMAMRRAKAELSAKGQTQAVKAPFQEDGDLDGNTNRRRSSAGDTNTETEAETELGSHVGFAAVHVHGDGGAGRAKVGDVIDDVRKDKSRGKSPDKASPSNDAAAFASMFGIGADGKSDESQPELQSSWSTFGNTTFGATTVGDPSSRDLNTGTARDAADAAAAAAAAVAAAAAAGGTKAGAAAAAAAASSKGGGRGGTARENEDSFGASSNNNFNGHGSSGLGSSHDQSAATGATTGTSFDGFSNFSRSFGPSAFAPGPGGTSIEDEDDDNFPSGFGGPASTSDPARGEESEVTSSKPRATATSTSSGSKAFSHKDSAVTDAAVFGVGDATSGSSANSPPAAAAAAATAAPGRNGNANANGPAEVSGWDELQRRANDRHTTGREDELLQAAMNRALDRRCRAAAALNDEMNMNLVSASIAAASENRAAASSPSPQPEHINTVHSTRVVKDLASNIQEAKFGLAKGGSGSGSGSGSGKKDIQPQDDDDDLGIVGQVTRQYQVPTAPPARGPGPTNTTNNDNDDDDQDFSIYHRESSQGTLTVAMGALGLDVVNDGSLDQQVAVMAEERQRATRPGVVFDPRPAPNAYQYNNATNGNGNNNGDRPSPSSGGPGPTPGRSSSSSPTTNANASELQQSNPATNPATMRSRRPTALARSTRVEIREALLAQEIEAAQAREATRRAGAAGALPPAEVNGGDANVLNAPVPPTTTHTGEDNGRNRALSEDVDLEAILALTQGGGLSSSSASESMANAREFLEEQRRMMEQFQQGIATEAASAAAAASSGSRRGSDFGGTATTFTDAPTTINTVAMDTCAAVGGSTPYNDHAAAEEADRPLIEIAPGRFEFLRGSQETWAAIKAGHFAAVRCTLCQTELRCVADAEMVICPDCRVVSPLTDDSQSGHLCGGGVGLGVKVSDLSSDLRVRLGISSAG